MATSPVNRDVSRTDQLQSAQSMAEWLCWDIVSCHIRESQWMPLYDATTPHGQSRPNLYCGSHVGQASTHLSCSMTPVMIPYLVEQS